MTIGNKIKYLRKRLNITQNNLADKSNIHPVSIRKYETNKMKPQPNQIEKLAEALDISSFALIDNYENLKCYSLGDFYSIIILLYKFDFLSFNLSQINNNIEVIINKNVYKLFNLKNYKNDITENLNQQAVSISISEKLKATSSYHKFIEWIKICNQLKNFKNTLSNPTTENAAETINMFQEKIEILELELQQSSEILSEL